MSNCCVPSCNKQDGGRGAHSFPKDENLRRLWIKQINRGNWQPKKTSIVCNAHFVKSDFISKSKTGYTMKNKILKPNAIPTQFPSITYPSIFQNKLTLENKRKCTLKEDFNYQETDIEGENEAEKQSGDTIINYSVSSITIDHKRKQVIRTYERKKIKQSDGNNATEELETALPFQEVEIKIEPPDNVEYIEETSLEDKEEIKIKTEVNFDIESIWLPTKYNGDNNELHSSVDTKPDPTESYIEEQEEGQTISIKQEQENMDNYDSDLEVEQILQNYKETYGNNNSSLDLHTTVEIKEEKDLESTSESNVKKPYKCQQCDKVFAHLGNLALHSVIHTGAELHSCEICGKKFTRFGSLLAHQMIHERGQTLLNFNLKVHKRKHMNEKARVECPLCHKYFTSLVYLNTHKEKYHTASELKKCEEKLQYLPGMHDKTEEFLHIHDGDYYSCEICGRTFQKLFNLICHMNTHTEEHKCNFCHKVFIQDTYLTKHKNRFHYSMIKEEEKKLNHGIYNEFNNLIDDKIPKKQIAEKIYKCPTCDVVPTPKEGCKRPYRCGNCRQRFYRCCELKKHLIVHASPPDEKLSSSQISKTYVSREKKHSCEICGKKFTWLSFLNAHKESAHQ